MRDMAKQLNSQWISRFIVVVQPILDAVDLLVRDRVGSAKTYGRFGSQARYVENDLGRRYYLDGRPPLEIRKKVPALILHGKEARFVFTLIIEAAKAGIPIISYQYDGVIVGRRIPRSLIARVQQMTGLAFTLSQKAM